MKKPTYLHTYYEKQTYKEETFVSSLEKVGKAGLGLGALVLVIYVPFIVVKKLVQCVVLKKESVIQ